MAKARLFGARLTVILLGSLVLIISLAVLRLPDSLSLADALMALVVFAGFVAAGDFLSISLPQGGSVSVSSSVLLAGVLLFPVSDVVVVGTAGSIVGLMVRRVGPDPISWVFTIAERNVVIFLTGIVFRALGGVPGDITLYHNVLPLFAACATCFLTDVGLDQLFHNLERRPKVLPAALGVTKLVGPLYMAFSALGILIAAMYKDLSFWSIPLFFLPLLMSRYAFSLYLSIRKLYENTIRALAVAIEAHDPLKLGHAERVANFALEMARDLGVHGPKLELVGYAALLHDVGKLGVEQDLPGAFNLKAGHTSDSLHAMLGAEIVDQVKFLKGASELIRKHQKPYDGEKRAPEIDHPVGSRIIGLASHYDDLTKAALPEYRLTPDEAVTRIKKDQGLRFDPKVVRSLIRVLTRERVLRKEH